MAHDGDISHGQLPLKGTILCCTSLTQDARIKAEQVSTQMGAIYKLDLTSDVTHLVVGSVSTPKYRYVAKERPDVKVLHPDWLENVRLAWMEGGDVDLSSLEGKFKLPTFFGLQICLTGFDNLEQRNSISSNVEEQGARYHGDLTKQVTQLIVAAPQGAKYTHARQWGIPVVSLKWFEDSLVRGMSLDETLYDPTLPVEEQGKGAYRTSRARPVTTLGKRDRDNDSQGMVGDEYGKRRLRRTASTRLTSQSQDMWMDMSAAGSLPGPIKGGEWHDNEPQPAPIADKSRDGAMHAHKALLDTHDSLHNQAKIDGLFGGWHIYIHGFSSSRTTLLHNHLEANGATVVDRPSDLDTASSAPFFRERCMLVPHAAPASPDLPDVPPGTTLATEWWVERCLHLKKQINPETDVLSQPLWVPPVPDLTGLVISTTGFQNLDLRQTAEAAKLVGASYSEKLTPTTSVLITGVAQLRREKALYASKHRIAVVGQEWLWDCFRKRQRLPFEKYKVTTPEYDPTEFSGKSGTDSPSLPAHMTETSAGRTTRGHEGRIPQQRLSNDRQRNPTPTLPLQPQKDNQVAQTTKRQPPRQVFQEEVEEDETPSFEDEQPSAAASEPVQPVPLRELSPNKSPKKPESDHASFDDEASKPLSKSPPQDELQGSENSRTIPKPNPVEPVAAVTRPQEQLTANLQSLLARQKINQQAAAATVTTGTSPIKRKKPRQLGRAASGLSARSPSLPAPDLEGSKALGPEAAATTIDGVVNSDSMATARPSEPPPPNTQLTYDQPDAEAHRRQMAELMGGPDKMMAEDKSKGIAAERIGVVKDVETAGGLGGVGGRVKGRTRGARPKGDKVEW